MSKIHSVNSSEDLRKAIETTACLDFASAFLGLCQRLRPSRGRAHVFIFRPEGAQPIDPAVLTQTAQEAHVCVHAICSRAMKKRAKSATQRAASMRYRKM